jgi:hypothetical protein
MEKVESAQIETAGEFPEKSLGQQQQHNQGDIVLIGENHEVRKIPIPTDDPNDPLNWPKWRKAGVVGTCCWFGKWNLLMIE